jgi:hypothetical protein
MDYFIGGSTLLSYKRGENNIKNWPYGISVACRHEDYIKNLSKLIKLLRRNNFFLNMNNNRTGLKEKIKAVYDKKYLYEITPWFQEKKYRIRARYKLPKKIFRSGFFIEIKNEKFQTFNTPIEYLTFRFIDWKTPIDSTNRKLYENKCYWREQ